MQYDKFLITCANTLLNDTANSVLSDEEFDKKADDVAASRYESECVDCLKDFASRDTIDPPQCVKVSSKEPLIF